MTHREAIIEAFRRNKGRMALGHILKFPWGYEFRARATELRKAGYIITCEKGVRPSDNMYTLVEPEETGQLRFVA